MYVYVTVDKPAQPVAVLPRSKGRVANGHYEILPDIFVGFIDPEKASLATTAAELRSCVRAPDLTMGPAESIQNYHATVCGLLTAALDSFNAPNLDIIVPSDKIGSVKKGIAKHRDNLTKHLDAIKAAPEDKAAIDAAFEAYAASSKISNMLLRVRGGWAPYAGAVAAMEAEAMSLPEADGFGFDKLAGDRPELKIADEPGLAADENSGVFWPKPDKTYILNENVDRLFKTIQAASDRAPQNVRLVGPHGCGKTELAIQYAARYNRPLLIMDCANLREARDWFGYKSAKDGTVFWHESQFVKAVESGNHVILLDELNRATPHVLNTLLPLLDARRFTYLEERGAVIKVGPGTVFCASMNEGAGYTGTSAVDLALADRFPRVVELSYLGEKDEINLLMRRTGINADIAGRLVQTANKVRADSMGINASMSKAISTRQLLAAAHDFVLGGVDTLTFTIINHFSPDGDNESERAKVTAIIQGKFGDIMEAAKTSKKGA